ncbi:MAG TPA: hypothetical protein VED46_00905 [Alphaproteobacteria bacterium]|jgi:hypothetical protein|nr:hypothetical protein [Alphaproteobacteria bacterium]
MLLRSRLSLGSHVATGRERLTMLATFVESLPPERLSLTRWFGFGKGCAVAWAATDPWFRAQGLRLEAPESLAGCRPEYRQRTDWAAVASFFEITLQEAQLLFGSASGLTPDPATMADRIRCFLAERAAA